MDHSRNPRYPHYFTGVVSQLDEKGYPVVDSNGDPIEREREFVLVEMGDFEPRKRADGSFITHNVMRVPFGYRTNSMNTQRAGDVVVSDYKLSTPILLTHLEVGDVLTLHDYEYAPEEAIEDELEEIPVAAEDGRRLLAERKQRSFQVQVVKMTSFNFGTSIWVDEIKN